MRASRLTIRTRITGGSLLIAILISIVVGIIIFSQLQRIVSDGQIRVLENVEGVYLTAIKEGGSDEVDPPGAGQLVAVISPDGTVQVDTLPSVLTVEIDSLITRPDETRTVRVGADASAESFVVRVTTVQTSTGAWNVITANRSDVESSVLNQLAFLLIASIAGINIAFGAASWFIGTAALGPVDRLRRSAATLLSSPAGEMLPVGPARDELSELATTLNELISQLRASAERERQIVSNASHEFRTPLAIIQTQLELAQLDATTLQQMQSDVAAAQRTLARLSALATSMLELSRIDAQGAPGSAVASELATELADAADRGRARVGPRNIQIEYACDGSFGDQLVAVSEADFGRVCDNLVNNALAALGEEGLITLSLSSEDSAIRLRVSDDGGGMAESFVPLAFDRFSRADDARSGGGAGLGLSIVTGIVSTAGGAVHLENAPGVGLTVDIIFPLID